MFQALSDRIIARFPKASAPLQWLRKHRKTRRTWRIVFFHLLGLLTSINAILSVRTSQGAVAWVVSLPPDASVASSSSPPQAASTRAPAKRQEAILSRTDRLLGSERGHSPRAVRTNHRPRISRSRGASPWRSRVPAPGGRDPRDCGAIWT